MSKDIAVTLASILIITALWVLGDLWFLKKGPPVLPQVSEQVLAPLDPKIDESIFARLREKREKFSLTSFKMATPSATPSSAPAGF